MAAAPAAGATAAGGAANGPAGNEAAGEAAILATEEGGLTEVELRALDMEAQLEEAAAVAARAERVALDARAQANTTAAEARADAWYAIAKANKEVDEMKEKVKAALKAKSDAEADLADGQAAVVAAQAAAAAAGAEAVKLRRDLADARAKNHELEAKVVHLEGTTELGKLRKDYDNCKAALAEAELELQTVRSALAAEQARCFRLEVEVAEYRQRLAGMAELEKELHLLQKQHEAAEEAALAANSGRSRAGWGWGSK